MSKEEIMAKQFGWSKYSSGPVMCETSDFIACMDAYASQAVMDDREKVKIAIYKAMHDGVLKHGVRVKPSAKDLSEVIDKLQPRSTD